MEQKQTKPGRNLRRWLVVFFLAVVSAVSWWLWPRVDQRLVGRWDSGNGVFELRDDGETMFFYASSYGRTLSVNGNTAWRVQRNRFRISGGRFTLMGWLTNLYEHVKFGRDPSIIFEAEVVEVGPNRFVLREESNTYSFDRMPD